MQESTSNYLHHGNEISQGYENIFVLSCHKSNKHVTIMKKREISAFCFNFKKQIVSFFLVICAFK